MKKFVLIFCCAVGISSCLETKTNTTINENGSGKMQATIDVSEGMEMLMKGKKPGPAEQVFMDTTITIRTYSDTATILNSRQKDLLREMAIKFLMDFRDGKTAFVVSIETPFKTLADLNDLNELMKQPEYDIVFDKAFKIPMFNDKDEAAGNMNDNLFGSVFPGFYQCNYKKGSISCEVDTAAYRQTLADLGKMEFDLNGEMETKVFGASKFTNTLVLPAKPKGITGNSWKQGDKENVLVQQGTLLEIYKNPGDFSYTIQY